MVRAVQRISAGMAAALVITLTGCSTVATEPEPVAESTLPPEKIAELESGLWYFKDSGIAEAHEAATGEGVTIALFSSPVNPDAPQLKGARIHAGEVDACAGALPTPAFASDETAHYGTNEAAMIVGNGEPIQGMPGVPGIAPDADLLVYNLDVNIDSEGAKTWGCQISAEYQSEAVADAVSRGADIIVIPTSFPFGTFSVAALNQAMKQGVIVVAGGAVSPSAAEVAEPRPENLLYSSQFNGAITVESHGPDGERDDPVVGEDVGIVAPGLGTLSYNLVEDSGTWDGGLRIATANQGAAAFVAGALALAWSAHPEASGFQIQHALANTASNAAPEPERTDEEGFGMIDVPALVAEEIDPDSREYDVDWLEERANPFLTDEFELHKEQEHEEFTGRQPYAYDVDQGFWFPPEVRLSFVLPREYAFESPNGRAMPGDSDFSDPE